MTEETKDKIEEYWSMLQCEAGYSDCTAIKFRGFVNRYFEKYDEITPQDIETCVSMWSSTDEEKRRAKRALIIYYEWITSGTVPKKLKKYKIYRPKCSRDCVHMYLATCTYVDDNAVDRLVPSCCEFYEKRREKKRFEKTLIGESGQTIKYKDSHSVMYG